MRLDNRKHRRVACRTCGTDITEHAQYTRWTECSVCYWRGRFERMTPLENLLNKRAEVLARLDVLPSQVENARLAWIAYMRELEQKAPL
jgi:hypothetical protein